jgi:integrase
VRGIGRSYQRGSIWWIRYWHRGREYRESSESAREGDAIRLLKHRLKEIGRGRFVGPAEDKVLFTELLDALEVDYRNNGRRSTPTLLGRLKPLRAAFALDRAVDVTEGRIARYKADRLAAETKRETPVAPATLNRELAALKRAFRLAVEQKRLTVAPTIKLLAEHNARQGFLEPKTFEAVVAKLPGDLRDFARFAYLTGWRKGELTTLAWSDVDRATARIRLRHEHSKNHETRVLVLADELAAIIERRWQARRFGKDRRARLAELVFHRHGRAVANIKRPWKEACQAAGVAGTLFHDLRRSAVRNMDRARVTQSVAMAITGHKTTSIYRRYRIVDEADIGEALALTQASVRQAATAKVKSMRDASDHG